MKLSELNPNEVKPAGTLRLSEIDSSQINVVKPPTPVQEEKKPNYFERVGKTFKESGDDVVKAVKRGSDILLEARNTDEMFTPIEALKSGVDLVRTGGRVVGEVAGSAFSPILEFPGIKQALEKGAEQVLKIPGAMELVFEANKLAEKYPEAAKDVEAIFNIVTLGTGKALSQPLKTEVKAILRDAREFSKVVLKPSEEAVQKNVINLFNKGIKPTTKKTLGQAERYQNQTLEALTTIKQNADQLNIIDETGELVTGKAPQTINELAQAVDQTKSIVYKQYDELARQSNALGATIDTNPIANEVLKVSQNKALQITNPELVKYAESWAERLRNMGQMDTETTQAVIQNLNNNLQAFYKNPTYDSASKVAIDAGIANNLRKSLDDAIENATGEEYQVLKNQYSALKAIEQDVVRATIRDARKNSKGLLDYTDMFTSGQMLAGVLSLNPVMFTKGAVERGFKEYIKYLNDPNRAIRNLFDQIEIEPRGRFAPSSATGKFLQDPKLGLSVQSITPEYIAKKVDSQDLNIITKYLENDDIISFMEAQPLIEAMGLKGMEEPTLKRFLQEVVDLNGGSRTTTRKLVPELVN